MTLPTTESVKIDQSEGVKDSRMASSEKDFHGFYSLLSPVAPPFFFCSIPFFAHAPLSEYAICTKMHVTSFL